MGLAKTSNISNNLLQNVLNGPINRTTCNDHSNDAFDFNDLIGSLTGGNAAASESSLGGFDFQDLLNQLTKGGNGNAGQFNLQDIISQVTQGAQQNQEQHARGGGGLTDLIKGFLDSGSMSVFCKNGISLKDLLNFLVRVQVLLSF